MERFPHLRYRPVGVTWTGEYVITSNYRVRALGLPKSGVAARYAPLCPSMAFIPASMARYREASRGWLRVFQSFPGVTVHRKSIDEAWLDLTDAVLQRIRTSRHRRVQPHSNPGHLRDIAGSRHAQAEARWRREEGERVAGSGAALHPELLESSGSLRSGLEGSMSTDPITQRQEALGYEPRLTDHRARMEKQVRLDERVKTMSEEEIEEMCRKLHPIDHCRACPAQMEPIELVDAGKGGGPGQVDGIRWLPWVGTVLMAEDADRQGTLDEDSDDEVEREEEDEDALDGRDSAMPNAPFRPAWGVSAAEVSGCVDPPPVDLSLEDGDNPSDDYLLMVGSQVAFDIRQAVFLQMGLTTSAGIAPNPMLAKLASSLHKPNQQSIVRLRTAKQFIAPIPLRHISGFGPKQQLLAASHGYHLVRDVQSRSYADLVAQCGEQFARRLYDIAQAEDHRPVEASGPPQSINQSKRAPARTDPEKRALIRWLAGQLWQRIVEDAANYERWPATLILSWIQHWPAALSRRVHLPCLTERSTESAVETLYGLGVDLLEKHAPRGVKLYCLSLCVTNFERKPSSSISTYFAAGEVTAVMEQQREVSVEVTDEAIDAMFLGEQRERRRRTSKRMRVRGPLDGFMRSLTSASL